MNIFYLHDDVEACAQLHCDSHSVKMVLETGQMLCTAAHELGFEDVPYKAVHRNHPCSVWARANRSNFQWLQELGMALCREYTYRYGKVHKSQAVIEKMYTGCGLGREVYESLGSRSMSRLPQCMPDEYKVDCTEGVTLKWEGWVPRTIRAYQNYYRGEKAGFAKWTKRDVPRFMVV